MVNLPIVTDHGRREMDKVTFMMSREHDEEPIFRRFNWVGHGAARFPQLEPNFGASSWHASWDDRGQLHKRQPWNEGKLSGLHLPHDAGVRRRYSQTALFLLPSAVKHHDLCW
jgi:hypothetical protein